MMLLLMFLSEKIKRKEQREKRENGIPNTKNKEQ